MAESLTRPPCASSRCDANAVLSLSREKPDTEKLRYGDAKTGVVRVAWYADFVFVPTLALISSASAPPKTLRIRAVMF